MVRLLRREWDEARSTDRELTRAAPGQGGGGGGGLGQRSAEAELENRCHRRGRHHRTAERATAASCCPSSPDQTPRWSCVISLKGEMTFAVATPLKILSVEENLRSSQPAMAF